jgi:cation-transporting ATPase E
LQGLSEDEVHARRARGLANTAPPPTSRSYQQIIGENVFTFINVCLFLLGLALVLLGRPANALVSTGVITLNVLVSVVKEIRAKRTLDRIALLARPTATVIRDGQEHAVPPEELVVGDVLAVGPGDQIVIDGRVVGDGRLAVDESQLTGESDLIHQRAGDPVYSGSFCITGRAHYVAEGVGPESLATQITAGARAFRRILTPRQREIYFVTRVVLLIVAYIEFIGVFPLALSQGAPVTLLTVGMPSVLLAVWTRLGPTPQGLLLERLAHFVLPPVMLTGAISMVLFYGALLLRLLRAGAIARPLAHAPLIRLYTPEVPVAQTALVTCLVLSGLLLAVFVTPPTTWWTGCCHAAQRHVVIEPPTMQPTVAVGGVWAWHAAPAARSIDRRSARRQAGYTDG